MLPFAVVGITLALVFYTVAVFWERRSGQLRWSHFVLFALGLVCDTTGTTLMTRLAGSWTWGLHSITGLAAILLMLAHTLWALWVLLRGSEQLRSKFHVFSIFVWALWLVPYLTGMVLNMRF
jgi:uncharacterized repeat protein (TIGR03987 family)